MKHSGASTSLPWIASRSSAVVRASLPDASITGPDGAVDGFAASATGSTLAEDSAAGGAAADGAFRAWAFRAWAFRDWPSSDWAFSDSASDTSAMSDGSSRGAYEPVSSWR